MDLLLNRIVILLDQSGTGLIVIATANIEMWFYSINNAVAPNGYHIIEILEYWSDGILDFRFRISDWKFLQSDKFEISIPQSAIPNPQSIHSSTPRSIDFLTIRKYLI